MVVGCKFFTKYGMLLIQQVMRNPRDKISFPAFSTHRGIHGYHFKRVGELITPSDDVPYFVYLEEGFIGWP